MRKKTKLKVLFLILTLLLFAAAVGGVYIYQDMQLVKQKTDYEIYIKHLKEDKKMGYVLTQDVEMGHKLGEEDIKEALFDPAFVTNDLIETKEEIIGQTVKVSLKAKQVLTASILFNKKIITDDLRAFELSSAVTPSFLKELDFVDVRINFPTGLDYVVLSKKKVDSIYLTDDEHAPIQYLRFLINADEILRLSSAIVDAFYKKGTYLYAIKYVEPDAQKDAIVNYPVNPEVRQLILSDPNIVVRAQLELEKSNRDALMASFAGYGMMDVRDKPLTVIEKAIEGDKAVQNSTPETENQGTDDALQNILQ